MFSVANIINLLVNLINVAVPVIGLVAISARVRGAARKLGVLGCAVLAGTGLLQTVWIFAGPMLVRRSVSSIAVLYGVVGLVFTVLSALGLILLIAAVVSGRSAATRSSAPQPYPPAGPGGATGYAPGYGTGQPPAYPPR